MFWHGHTVVTRQTFPAIIVVGATNTVKPMKEREMTWIGLGNPTPAPAVLPYRSFDWRNGDRVFLPIENFVLQGSLSDVLNSRRTARTFGPIESKDLSAILWLTCRIQQTLSLVLGFPLTLRPVPSAGAIHPIHVLILERSVAAWQRYDPLQHSLVTVYGSESFADASRKAASEVLRSTRVNYWTCGRA